MSYPLEGVDVNEVVKWLRADFVECNKEIKKRNDGSDQEKQDYRDEKWLMNEFIHKCMDAGRLMKDTWAKEDELRKHILGTDYDMLMD